MIMSIPWLLSGRTINDSSLKILQTIPVLFFPGKMQATRYISKQPAHLYFLQILHRLRVCCTGTMIILLMTIRSNDYSHKNIRNWDPSSLRVILITMGSQIFLLVAELIFRGG